MDLLNPAAGGGLSNKKLADATATENDVKKGKTFYAGNKTIKTGTYIPHKSYTSTTGSQTSSVLTFDIGFKPTSIYVEVYEDVSYGDGSVFMGFQGVSGYPVTGDLTRINSIYRATAAVSGSNLIITPGSYTRWRVKYIACE